MLPKIAKISLKEINNLYKSFQKIDSNNNLEVFTKFPYHYLYSMNHRTKLRQKTFINKYI
jgi:hypothetical protein